MFKECRHIKDDGQRCHAAALSGKPYCFFHMKFDRMHKRDTPEIPPLENSTSILLAIGQVIRALNYETMDCKRAGLMLYGLQIAASVAKQREHAEPAESVRSIHNLAGEPLDFNQTSVFGADMLAPEHSVCEPPHDCASCDQNNSCDKRKALTQSSPAHSWDDKIHDPERAAREVREELYAIAFQGENESGEVPEHPVPTIEEFHRYFDINAASADSPGAQCLPLRELNTSAFAGIGERCGCPRSLAFGHRGEMRMPTVPRIWAPGRDADRTCPTPPAFEGIEYDNLT
jgi:hypothetical protein